MTIPAPPVWAFDIECYVNYFLVMARNVFSGEIVTLYERFDDEVLGEWQYLDSLHISFNGNNYDIPMLSLASTGADNKTLKRASDAIIVGGLKPWDLEREFGFKRLESIDHIDLIEVAPGTAGLKIYGGRMHSKRMQDLPIEPGATILPADLTPLREYCGNDLLTTIDLYTKLQPQIKLRVEMSREFGIDLRSKSDAQIAEAVIRSQVEKRLGRRIYRPELSNAYKFKYRMPEYVHFNAPGLVKVLEIIREADFVLDKDGSVEMPKILESMRLRIGKGVYRMGIGGLHSSETSVSHRATPECRIVDRDVTSYYPSIILTQGLYPSHMGRDFLEVYRSLVERRITAKHDGDTVMADALKICVNGSFGKLGSKWSVLYSPDLLIAVTLTGQLALLMLIESLEENGFEVISANTDGVVTKVPVHLTELFNALVFAWEFTTGFNTEEKEYASIFSKDVNNYIAFGTDGNVKLKGLYAPSGLQKNATNAVCSDAVLALLESGVNVKDTIYSCKEIEKFLTVRQVKGGAVYGGEFLGKAVRWYYAKDETRHIAYKTNGNKVARSEGARPMMELTTTLPDDIDYEWYVSEAKSILHEIGA